MSSMTSRGDGERRLEATAALVVSGVLEYCKRRRGRGISRHTRERGEVERVQGKRGELHRVGIDDVWRRKP
jgi:hypothetical protein